jgi:hypothetical protein
MSLREIMPKKYVHPARIWIENGLIFSSFEGGDTWKLPIHELQVIGEYTTPNGPYADDYFVVFVSDQFSYTVSFYARGIAELLPRLGQELSEELEWALCNSTDWKSRIMWPPEIKDEPLFDFLPAPKPNGIIGRLKYRLLSPVELHFVTAVERKLNPEKSDRD